MREIKFRAWDKERKCIAKVLQIDFKTGRCYLSNGYVSYYKNYLLGECVLLEYTGLKDKNGKEIYAGDTVNKIIFGYTGKTKGCFSVVWNKLIGGWNISGKKGHCYEVIGNIYSNPKLIKENK